MLRCYKMKIDPDLIPPDKIKNEYIYNYLHYLAEEITKLRKNKYENEKLKEMGF